MLTGEQLRRSEGKEEGSDSAEPSLEGPVGKTSGNRPLNNQSPGIVQRPSKTQDLIWASGPARATVSCNYAEAFEAKTSKRLCRYLIS